jgi:hypothetical protein
MSDYYSTRREADCFTSVLRISHLAHRDRPHAFEVSRRILLALCALALAATVAAVGPPASAAATTPCWRQVVDDWFDGRIDRTYAPHCYREALRHLPVDARAYTSATGDIQRAMLAAIAERRRSTARGASPAGSSGVRRLQSVTREAARAPVPVRSERPLFERIAAIGASNGSARVPLPIVVLGVLTALLLTAAGASRLAHRLRKD